MTNRRHPSRSPQPASKWPSYALRLSGLAMILAALGLLARQGEVPPPVAAQDGPAARPAAPPPVGHLVHVALPVAGNSDQAVRTQIDRILKNPKQRGDARGAVIVLKFGKSEEQTGAGSEFGRAYELARFLLSEDLHGARTVAYVPHRLEGHALLAAMACQEIVMHQSAELGRAGAAGSSVPPVEREAYADVYSKRQTLPAAVAVGIIDPRVEVYRAEIQAGRRWIYAEQLAEIEKQPGYNGHQTVIKKDVIGNFSAGELRNFGFIRPTVSDLADLATALKVSKWSDDPAMAGSWNAILVKLNDRMNEQLATQSIKAIRDKMTAAENEGEPVNFLCVQLSSPGGSAADAISLIEEIEGLRRKGVYVAAYIPFLARADAAIIAMACDSILIDPDATLGGSGAAVLSEDDVNDLVDRIQALAKQRGVRWSPWAAMVKRDLVLDRYAHKGTGQVAHLCPEELAALGDADQWEKTANLDDARSLLSLNGEEAIQLALADHAANNFAEFTRQFGLEDEPELVRPNFTHKFIEGLKNLPWLPYFLLFIGTSALISELSSPGLGGPGFIALVFFALYFWLQFLKGDAGALEIILFLCGVGCLALEIFVIPGIGIFGIGGGAMVIASIVLASQRWVIPRNEYQLEQLPYSLLSVIAVGAGVFVGVLIMRRYGHKAPGLRGVMLAPPDDEEKEALSRREALADFTHLKGKRGTAATQLTPSGKARFGDDLVDVMADGVVVNKGTDVVVVGVQGNVVVVEPVE